MFARPAAACRLSVAIAVVLALAACSSPEARTARYLERGQDYMEQGKLDKARLEFRNALQVAPNNAQVRYDNGQIEERLGEYQRAAQLYQGAIDVDAGYDMARGHLARLWLFSGDTERALATLKPGLELHPNSVDLLAIRAAAKARLKDVDGAIEDAERANQLAPANEAAISVLAGLYNGKGQFDKARKLLEDALVRLPKSIDLHQVLVQFYVAQGDKAAAEKMLTELVALAPTRKEAYVALARYYVAESRIDDAERTMRAGIKQLPDEDSLRVALIELLAERRSRDAGMAELRAMIKDRPKDYDLQFTLGRYQEQQKAWDEAEATYRRVIAAEGKKAPALTARDRVAQLYLQQQKNLPEVRKLVAEVLEANPRDNDALLIRSQMAMAAGDAKSAVVDLRALVRDHPESAPLARQLARAYFANGERQLGEDTLRNAVNAHADDVAARFDLAQYYLSTARPDQARPLAEDLLQRDGKRLEYRQLAFQAAAAMKDYDSATAIAEKIRTDFPDQPVGPFLAGMMAETRGATAEALRQYDAALAISPTGQEPLNAAVQLLMRGNRPAEALARIDRVVAAAPEDAYALNMRGEVLQVQKRLAEAGEAFAAASKASPKWWIPSRNRALTLIQQKDVDGAIALMRSEASRLGQPEPLVGELAGLLSRLGRFDDAMASYEELLKKQPASEFAANNLAMMLVTYHTDAASLKRAGELVVPLANSRNSDLLDTTGWVRLKLGKAVEAMPVLEKAIAMSPDVPVIRYHLALAQFAAGQKQQARDNLERALQAKQEFEGVAEARAKLAEWKQAG